MAARDLVVTTIPNRRGKYLAFQDGSGVRVIARFSFEGADQEFVDWCVAAGIKYIDPKERENGKED